MSTRENETVRLTRSSVKNQPKFRIRGNETVQLTQSSVKNQPKFRTRGNETVRLTRSSVKNQPKFRTRANETVRLTRSSVKNQPKSKKPNLDKSFVRVTRSMSKNTTDTETFTIVEVYRCMPLLGGEENIPNWQVHVAKYSIEFVKK